MSRPSIRSFGRRAPPPARPGSALRLVSPQPAPQGKGFDKSPNKARTPKPVPAQPAKLPAQPRAPRTLAGATILQIVPSLREDPSAHAAVDTAVNLMQAGARAIVASEGGPLAGELRAFGVEWMPMPSETYNPLALRRTAGQLERMIANDRVDIIHAFGAGAAWSALSAINKMPVWLVTSFGDRVEPPSWFGGRFDGALAKGHRIVAPSSYVAQAMIERYRLSPDKIAVIPRRVDTAQFSPAVVHADRVAAMRRSWGILPNTRVVLVPGRIAPWNGQIGVVDAARLVVGGGRRNVAFVLVGDDRIEPAYRDAVIRRAHGHAVDTLFRMVGHCHDMPTALAAADVVVVPALKPPLTGRAAAEAQAMGRPVIVNAVGVLPENVLAPPRMAEELRTGWVVRPGHAGELARGIATALSMDRKAYEAMGARARQFAEFVFSPQSVSAATRGLYTSLLSRQP
jgi:glycosyltransferase involved in cell wall biosynthesis